MKFIEVLLFTGAAFGAVQPHRHRHRHAPRDLMNREPNPVADGAYPPVRTVILYILNGSPISEAEVMEGIHNGTLVWGDDGLQKYSSSTPTPTPTPTPTLTPSPSVYVAEVSSAPESSAVESSAAPASSASYGEGVDTPFPSGLPCSSFPSGYGAVPVDYMGMGGWIGIQCPGYSGGDGYNDISTVPKGSCSDGSCCKSGSFCSYNCPAGYLKASWPSLQGVTGQSVGGLYCNNGELEMASGSIAKTLCVKGTDKVKVVVQNKLSGCASICRTDYPGTEGETVPLQTEPNTITELACPEGSDYYHWDNKPTSAQYYLNKLGVEQSDACWWGNGSQPVGNYAPANLGVGFIDGKAWISIFQNAPTTNAKLDYTVEITGDNVVGKCKYSNGQYCSGDNYSDCNSIAGCTVAASSGTVTIVLS